MVAEAMAIFGPGTGGPVEEGPPPTAMDEIPVQLVVCATLAAGVLVLLGAVLVARRAGRRPEAEP